MRPIDDTQVTRAGRRLTLAYDQEIVHGPTGVAVRPENVDSEHVFGGTSVDVALGRVPVDA